MSDSSNVKLGPAGSSGLGGLKGVEETHRVGLDAMEIEFTYGVNMKNETAKAVGDLAKKFGITLSVHAPYYINLASAEKAKREASKKRILDSCERGHHLGAKHIIFHAAYYQKLSKDETYRLVKEAMLDMQATIRKNGWNVVLSPETTGKGTQFGDIDELSTLARETGCGICIDFAHIYARNNGIIDYEAVMRKIKDLPHKTAHFSGINYGPKGEKSHKLTEPERVEDLFNHLKKHNISITIINESPEPVNDALMMKKLREKIF
jgi:deoxyribonuclease IV